MLVPIGAPPYLLTELYAKYSILESSQGRGKPGKPLKRSLHAECHLVACHSERSEASLVGARDASLRSE